MTKVQYADLSPEDRAQVYNSPVPDVTASYLRALRRLQRKAAEDAAAE